MRKNFDQSVAQLGVTRSHWVVIAIVGRSPGATQRVIAEALEMTEVSAGRIVDKLCLHGLLERRPREDDRRAYSVYLTDKANPLMDKIHELADINEQHAFSGISDAEQEHLHLLLNRIYENIGEQKAAPTERP